MGPRFPPRLSQAARACSTTMPEVPRLALTATADARTRADILTQLGIPDDGLIDRRLRPAQHPLSRPPPRADRQAAARPARRRGRARDRLCAEPRQGGEDRRADRARTGRPALPYHAGLEPQVRRAQPGRVRQFRRDGDRGDDRLRHGHRQARRAARRPRRDPQEHRGLLPGDRPRRARRRAGRGMAVLGGAGFRAGPPADRAGGRAGAPPGRARAVERARDVRRGGRLPPRDPASPFRGGSARALRQLRQLPRAAGDDRRDRGRAQAAVGGVPDRDAVRRRATSPMCSAATTARRCTASAIIACRCSGSRGPTRLRWCGRWRAR